MDEQAIVLVGGGALDLSHKREPEARVKSHRVVRTLLLQSMKAFVTESLFVFGENGSRERYGLRGSTCLHLPRNLG